MSFLNGRSLHPFIQREDLFRGKLLVGQREFFRTKSDIKFRKWKRIDSPTSGFQKRIKWRVLKTNQKMKNDMFILSSFKRSVKNALLPTTLWYKTTSKTWRAKVVHHTHRIHYLVRWKDGDVWLWAVHDSSVQNYVENMNKLEHKKKRFGMSYCWTNLDKRKTRRAKVVHHTHRIHSLLRRKDGDV